MRTIRDHTGPYWTLWTIPDHMGPYGTKRDHTRPYRTMRDHIGPYGHNTSHDHIYVAMWCVVTQSHTGPYRTIWQIFFFKPDSVSCENMSSTRCLPLMSKSSLFFIGVCIISCRRDCPYLRYRCLWFSRYHQAKGEKQPGVAKPEYKGLVSFWTLVSFSELINVKSNN